LSLSRNMNQAAASVRRFKSAVDPTRASLQQLRGILSQADRATENVRKSAQNAGKSFNGLGTSKSKVDSLKGSLDKLKGAAKGAHGELQNVKTQADAVEKSVGKAGKNADAGGKSMGSLGKGLKGAGLAQKGLNLAMSASPFGLVMTLLSPLIAQFINMDKVTALLRKGVLYAWKGIQSASSGASKFLGPLLKGIVNYFLLPAQAVTSLINLMIGAVNRIHVKIPGWVPGIGGRSLGFSIPKVPVPRLAEGGVVQARSGGTLALLGEAGENEAVIPLSKLERMLGGSGGGLRSLTAAVEKLADRPVVVQVDSQEIARAVFLGQRQLARR